MALKNPEKEFLGTGWSFPPSFSRIDASVNMVSAEQDIRESLWILFSTSMGERIMVPEYGSDMWQMVFRSITNTLMTEIEASIRSAVLEWEPRIDVDEVSVQPDSTLEGKVTITLYYTIRQTNSRSNLVYPFYIQEGTLVSEPDVINQSA